MPYEPPDFYGIDELLTEDERMIRDAVRGWVEDRVLPVISEHYLAGTFPTELIPEMAELGLLGAGIDGYGCPGLGAVAYGLILQELERGDSGIRSFASVQGSLVMWPIRHYGSEEQRKRWLPALHKGEAIGCFGLTEPDHGSDPGGMETRAARQGDRYVLNGAKMWITNGSMADVAVVWAKLDGVVRGFLVEKGTPGFIQRSMGKKFSLRASDTSELVLQDVAVPLTSLMPGVEGLRGPLNCLSQARAGIAWGVCGAAMACYDEARRYALQRVQFGKPIGHFQIVQQKLVEALAEITKMQLLNLRMGRIKESGKITPQQVSMAKRNGCHHALEIARVCRGILGANGITAEYQVMRHMCNLESVITYEGTHDIHTLILGQAITGLDAFR
ncbi:MAG: acyl-CoA dehydrogenase family protein [Planctomycetes bacterium]|nr:acyl-CoA dehydrogenase family protein [Planctomycetota bacterium]